MYVLNGDGDGRSRKEPISPAVVALLGTALGIVGTIATTSMAAHYTSSEHANDRAEIRAKERRQDLIGTYTLALHSVRAYRDWIFNLEDGAKPEQFDPVLAKEAQSAGAVLALTGSESAYNSYEHILVLVDGITFEAKKGVRPGHDQVQPFMAACNRFTAEARNDISSNRDR